MKISELFESKKKPGTYAAAKLSSDTKKKIGKYLKDADIVNACDVDDMHCTILYSRKHLPDYKAPGRYDAPLIGKPGKFEIWPNKDKTKNVLVLTISSPDLTNRHKTLMKDHEATYDFPDYKPHVTFSYDFGESKLSDLKSIDFTIEFDEEYSEELDAS